MPHSIDAPTPDQPTKEEKAQPMPFPLVAGTAAIRCHMAAEQLYKSGNAQAAGLYEISATIFLCTAALYDKLGELFGKEEVPDAKPD